MKSDHRALAIFGAPPEFDEPLHVGRPNEVDRDRLRARVDGILDRGWLTNDGPLVRELEERVAEVAGVEHCVAMANGTVALEIAARAAGLRGEILVPSFTFVATAHALRWQGLRPRFCDVGPDHLLDPARVDEEAPRPDVGGIVATHLWGRPCDVEALQRVADTRGVPLLFDAAHAFGCSREGRPVGGSGRAEVFSFHATKFVSSGEGGAVVTDDADLAHRMRLMRNFGFTDYDRVIHLGTNGKMSEFSAAFGLTHLEDLDGVVAVNRRNREAYVERLADLPGVDLVPLGEGPEDRRNFQYVAVEVGDGSALARDELLLVLWAENVLARRYFYPGCHRMVPYRDENRGAAKGLPETERVAARVLVLPTGRAVDPEAIARIAVIFRRALSAPDEVRATLGAQLEELNGRQARGSPPRMLPHRDD